MVSDDEVEAAFEELRLRSSYSPRSDSGGSMVIDAEIEAIFEDFGLPEQVRNAIRTALERAERMRSAPQKKARLVGWPPASYDEYLADKFVAQVRPEAG